MLISPLLLAALLATQGAGPSPGTSQAAPPAARVRAARQGVPSAGTGVSLNPAFRTALTGGQVSIGGTLSNIGATPEFYQVLGSEGPGVLRIVANDPGTGFQEFFLLGIPSPLLPGDHPLLVMFHGAKASEKSCYLHGSALFDGARNRGWFVLSPLGSHDENFGSQEAQINTAYVLDLVTSVLPNINIDGDRIYGAGFSMGGGWMMSYAAQHQALGRPRFAALVNNAGTASIAYTYWHSSASQQQDLFEDPRMFGGPPTTEAHKYSQASIFDMDPSMTVVDFNLVNPNTDMGRNLAETPIRHYLGTADPNPGLVLATETANAWLATVLGFSSTLIPVVGAMHNWNTIQTTDALDFLQGKTLQTPTTGQHRVLADREGNWSHFYVYQDAGGAFTPFRWEHIPAGPGSAKLILDETKNLEQLVVSTQTLVINTANPLDVVMGSADGSAERTLLTGYATQPGSVTRAGVQITIWTGAPTHWHWDPVGQTVVLVDANPDPNVTWTITP